MPDVNTKLLAVIGDPIQHSLSPTMHNFIFQKLGLNYCYHAFQVTPENLSRKLEAFKILNFSGLNITLPLKGIISQYLNQIENEAAQLEAVNTVSFTDGKTIGFNTDVIGFMRAVEETGTNLAGENAIIIGAGGAARAIALALLRLKCKKIVFYNRTYANAQITAEFLEKKTRSNVFGARSLDDNKLFAEVKDAAILVNATSVGMFPDVEQLPVPESLELNSDILVFDAIYNPAETALMKFARKQGIKAVNGMDMLIFQGIAAEEIWMGKEIDIYEFYDELKIKLYKALENNGQN